MLLLLLLLPLRLRLLCCLVGVDAVVAAVQHVGRELQLQLMRAATGVGPAVCEHHHSHHALQLTPRQQLCHCCLQQHQLLVLLRGEAKPWQAKRRRPNAMLVLLLLLPWWLKELALHERANKNWLVSYLVEQMTASNKCAQANVSLHRPHH